MKNIMCVICRSAFSEEELGNADACPTCGSKGVPADLNDSVDIRITKHELRILTIWAANYAWSIRESGDKRSEAVINGIIGALNKQVADTPLTLAQEFQDVADTFGSKVETTIGDFEPPTKH